MVSTLDFESNNPSSILGMSSFYRLSPTSKNIKRFVIHRFLLKPVIVHLKSGKDRLMPQDLPWKNNCFRWENIDIFRFEMDDLDCLEADWKLAEEHGLACRPGLLSLPPTDQTQDFSPRRRMGNKLCPCCFNAIFKHPVPLCQNSKQLQFLGFGFPLYFVFLKYVIILLLLQILSYDALSLFKAVESTYDICELQLARTLPLSGKEVKCEDWMIRYIRTESTVSTEELVIRACSFVIQLLSLVYIRDRLRKTNQYYEERTISLSDYSIAISSIPKQQGIAAKIRLFLREGFSARPLEAEEMILINQLETYYEERSQKRELIKQKQKWLKNQNHPQREKMLEELSKCIAEKVRQIEQEYEREVQLIMEDKVQCEQAIVIFDAQEERDYFIAQFEHLEADTLKRYFGEGAEAMKARMAPGPKEIIWENINYPQSSHIFRLFAGWSLSALFIGAITTVFFFLQQVKVNVVEHALTKADAHPSQHTEIHQSTDTAMLFVMFAVILFNKFMLSSVLHFFTDLEKHSTRDEYEFSFGLKYTLGLFFTTAIMTLLVEDAIFGNVYSQKYGVADEESIMFFLNAFLVPFIWMVNPWQMWRLIRRKWAKGSTEMTQREANDLMEDAKYSMGKKYAEVIEFVWFTFLYCSLIPGGTILITIGLALFYWVDKYNLLRRSSINENISGGLSSRSTTLLDFSLPLRSLGQILFDEQIRSGSNIQSYVCLGIGLLYLLLPINKILACLHSERFNRKEKRYAEVRNNFIEDYRTMHPLFAREREVILKKNCKSPLKQSLSFVQDTEDDILRIRPTREMLDVSFDVGLD